MNHIGDLLGAAVGNSEILRAARGIQALRCWPEIVGEALAERSCPDRFARGTVWVAVTGSAWAQELRLIKPTILHRLSEISGEHGLFTDVRFGVRELPLNNVIEETEPENPADLDSFYEGKSIQEIRDRRMRIWQDERSD